MRFSNQEESVAQFLDVFEIQIPGRKRQRRQWNEACLDHTSLLSEGRIKWLTVPILLQQCRESSTLRKIQIFLYRREAQRLSMREYQPWSSLPFVAASRRANSIECHGGCTLSSFHQSLSLLIRVLIYVTILSCYWNYFEKISSPAVLKYLCTIFIKICSL